jgi:hypothetical protein
MHGEEEQEEGQEEQEGQEEVADDHEGRRR